MNGSAVVITHSDPDVMSREPAPYKGAQWSSRVFDGLEQLPASCDALFAGQTHFQSGLAWYRTVIRAAMPHGAGPRFVLCQRGERALALFPMQNGPSGALQSLTTPYTHFYQPLIEADATPEELHWAGQAFAHFCRRCAITRIDALDADWPHLTPLLAGIRQGGLMTQRFDHFGNWQAAVAGLTWEAYLAGRPGALRQTVRRKLRRAERDGKISFACATTTDAVASAIDAYEHVYRRSWKPAEPFADFNAALMQASAALGVLRLGVLRHDGQPVAAQYWIVENGCAAVLKLAHDDAYASLSPGTVLTAMMIRRLFECDRVDALDFGRGDDPYKQLWAEHRRQRIGLLLVNPLRPAGLLELGRSLVRKYVRRIG
jgi:CelD/BcsL family acetyltransferase involved in cellulose biosynthesis